MDFSQPKRTGEVIAAPRWDDEDRGRDSDERWEMTMDGVITTEHKDHIGLAGSRHAQLPLDALVSLKRL